MNMCTVMLFWVKKCMVSAVGVATIVTHPDIVASSARIYPAVKSGWILAIYALCT